MDISIDDGFGGLEKLIARGQAIDEQIMAGYQDSPSQEYQHQMQYYAALSGEIKDELVQKTDVDTLKEWTFKPILQ